VGGGEFVFHYGPVRLMKKVFSGNLLSVAFESLVCLCLFDCAAYLSSDLDGIRFLCKPVERSDLGGRRKKERRKQNFIFFFFTF
jgi:hypothetical protein